MEIEYKDKFVAFIDILGFTELVKKSVSENGMSLDEILELVSRLGSPEERIYFDKHGPTHCPEAAYSRRDLDFRLTQISDCVVMSAEVSPAGVMNLIHHSWAAVMRLLQKGIMCRGYITQGLIYHTNDQFIGPGYQEACAQDKSGEPPFVKIDSCVIEFVESCGDACVKEMFSRHVEKREEAVVLFPFKRFAAQFGIGGFLAPKFDPERARQNNQNVRQILETLKQSIYDSTAQSNPGAVINAEHYIKAYNEQLDHCDKTDKMIRLLSSEI